MIRTSFCAAALVVLALAGSGACTAADLPGGACGTCAEIYTNGGIPCAPGSASDAWHALADCACGTGACVGSCGGTFCVNMPADEMCGECLVMSCAAQESSCASN